jgi:hypothetical protein
VCCPHKGALGWECAVQFKVWVLLLRTCGVTCQHMPSVALTGGCI